MTAQVLIKKIEAVLDSNDKRLERIGIQIALEKDKVQDGLNRLERLQEWQRELEQSHCNHPNNLAIPYSYTNSEGDNDVAVDCGKCGKVLL